MIDLSGQWKFYAKGQKEDTIHLPGTLDTNQIGTLDTKNLASRLTRVHRYEGEAHFIKEVILPADGSRLFFEAERTRQLRCFVNKTEIKPCVPITLSTPAVFEVTAFAGQKVTFELISDNRYQGFPRSSILNSSAATDETQTNWNGILGYLRIRKEPSLFIESIRIYPYQTFCNIEIDLNGMEQLSKKEKENYQLTLSCPAFLQDITCCQEDFTVFIKNIPIREDSKRWDEEEGFLYELTVSLKNHQEKTIQEKKVRFGIRTFRFNSEKRLTLNDRVFFLRGETNCCVFPEEGHPPMTVLAWKQVLQQYALYGANYVRFHSWCPPEAAFLAADELGMMMQPELSHWNCQDAFQDPDSVSYYEQELYRILSVFCNHPSFVMMTFGNELYAKKEGKQHLDRLLTLAKQLDPTRLYANSSNYHYGEEGEDEQSDFYTSSNYYKAMLRATNASLIGHLNETYPSACHNYEKTVDLICKKGKPVFGFEVGQYQILPDFKEIETFQGVTRPINLEMVKQNAIEAGMLNDWEQYVQATGELALICYREEVEAVLRTPSMSGLCLLGLQDFPGQGTALVGMLNSHLKPKPYEFAKPERFHRFFNSVVVLLGLPRYTYTEGETLQALIQVANYGKKKRKAAGGVRLWEKETLIYESYFPEKEYPTGGLFEMGSLKFSFSPSMIGSVARRYQIEVFLEEYKSEYPIWVYPKDQKPEAGNTKIKIASGLSEKLLEEILNGAVVFFDPTPTKERLPNSIGGQFSTDFWSVGTFPNQEGMMGLVIDTNHPIFRTFPTEFHSNWQWWSQSGGRPFLLPRQIHPIITVADSFYRLRSMGLLIEAKVGQGAVMISGMGLQEKKQYPENRALLFCILQYMNSKEFLPTQRLSVEQLKTILSFS